MKIIAIARNFASHAKELNNPVPDAPVVFMKPRTALLDQGAPFYHPEFSNHIDHEAEIVLRICKNGKHIKSQFARPYYDAISIGIDFTARDLQNNCKEKGLPWEIAKSFDGSAAVGKWIGFDELSNPDNIAFSMTKNGELVQEGFSADLLFSFDKIIEYASQFFTFNIGDILFTGTPPGVSPVKIGDSYIGFIEDKELLSCEIK